MSGSGPAVDDDGNLFVVTGNSGPAKSSPVVDPTTNLQESVIKFDKTLDPPLDYFTPSNIQELDAGDMDFGSGGVMLIAGQYGKMNKYLGVAAGKDGKMFLFDRNNLGHFNSAGNTQILSTVDIGQCWCAESFFVGADNVARVLSSGGDGLTAWKLLPDQPNMLVKDWDADMTLGAYFFQKGFFTSISSDGAKSDTTIVWAVQRPTGKTAPGLTLWAFDAKDGATLVRGIPAGDWPNVIGAANTVPVVDNGRVYVASDKALMVFGLGAAVAAQPSVLAEQARPLSSGPLFGTVVEVNDSTLWLRTETRMVRVDIRQAIANRAILVPGKAVVVYGSPESGGIYVANMWEHAPSSPSLWPKEN